MEQLRLFIVHVGFVNVMSLAGKWAKSHMARFAAVELRSGTAVAITP